MYSIPKSADHKHFIPAINWIEWELSQIEITLSNQKRKESITGRRNIFFDHEKVAEARNLLMMMRTIFSSSSFLNSFFLVLLCFFIFSSV